MLQGRGDEAATAKTAPRPAWQVDLVAGALDSQSPVPLYFQLARAIEKAIDRGDLAPGSWLENEVDLGRVLGLSRPTVRQALGYLVDRGRLVRRRGIGTMVLPPIVRRGVGLTSLYDDVARSGRKPGTHVLLLEQVTAGEDVAETLGIGPEEVVLHLRRLRLVDDEPLAIMENFLPFSFASISRKELERSGLYQLMAAVGLIPRFASQTVRARPANEEEADLLEVAAGAAILNLKRVSCDVEGRVIELAQHAYVGDRYEINMNLAVEDR